MDPRLRRLLPLIIGVVVVVAAAWWLHRRTVPVQTRLLLGRMESAVASRSAGALVGQTHPDYDMVQHWSRILTQSEFSDQAASRDLVKRLLQAVFFMHRERPLQLEARLTGEPSLLPDGRIEIRASFHLATTDGSVPYRFDPPLTKHRLVLARTSWFSGRLAIIDHDPLAVDR